MKKIFTCVLAVSAYFNFNAQSAYSFQEFISKVPVNNNDVYNLNVDIFDSKIFELSATNNSAITRFFRLEKTEVAVPANATYAQTVCTQSFCYASGSIFPPISNGVGYGQSLAPGSTSLNTQGKPGFTFEIKLTPQTVGLYKIRYAFKDSTSAADSLSFTINYTVTDPSAVKLNDLENTVRFPTVTKKGNRLILENKYNENFQLSIYQLDGTKLFESTIAPRTILEKEMNKNNALLIRLSNPLTGQYSNLKYSFID
jgi:hypothetical protein